MSFDKARVLEGIRQLLATMQVPDSPLSLEKAGWVERVIAREGQVHVVLGPPAEAGAVVAQVRQELERRISELEGVHSVQVLEKPHASGAPAAASPSPASATQGAGFGAQGVPGVRHVVAVASGKGGVGKSTVAVNLAAALVAAGQRVGLLDSDVYGPSVPKMLGLEGRRPRMHGENVIETIQAHGLTTMSIGFLLEDDDAPVIWRGPMVTGLLRQFLFQVDWGTLDYLIVDMPPGTGDAQLTLVQQIALSGGVIVTTPQDVALLDVQRGIEMFRRVNVPVLGVVENMSVFHCPQCGHEARIFAGTGGRRAAEKYGVPFLGEIPLDPDYTAACDAGTPTVVKDPEAPLSRVMADIARMLIERLR